MTKLAQQFHACLPPLEEIDALFIARNLPDGVEVKVALTLEIPGGGYISRTATLSREELVGVLASRGV